MRRAGRILTTILLGVVCLSTTMAQETGESLDEELLFAEIFGTETTQSEQRLPVVTEGRFLGEVTTRISPGQTLVDGAEVAGVVASLLNDDARQRLEELGNAGMVDIGEFNPLGVFLVYQPEQVRLNLSLAADVVRERTLGGTGQALLNLQEPAELSGYINLLARTSAATIGEPDLVQAELEPVVNYQGWVVESLVGLSSGDEPVTLRHTRLVRDLPSLLLRGEAGIVRYDSSPLFGRPEVVGFSATRMEMGEENPGLYREGTARFVMPREGTVDLFLNERIYRNYRLTPGPHTVRELPLGSGSNTLRVVERGGELLMNEQIPFSPSLLIPGRHFYSTALGVIRESSLPEGLFGNAIWRYGLGPTLTVGGGTQLSPEAYAFSAQGLWATRGGVSRGEGAVYLDTAGESGGAVELGHTLSLLYARRLPTVDIQGRYQNETYQHVLGVRSFGSSLRGGITLNQQLGKGTQASLAVQQTWGLSDGAPDETTLRFSTYYRAPAGYSLNVQIGPTFREGEVSWQGSIFVRISTDDRGMTTSANYDLAQGPATVQVSNAPAQPFHSFSWSTTARGVDRTPGSVEALEGTLAYSGYRGTVQLEPGFQQTIGAERGKGEITAQFASALAWAGGAPLVTRPIRNGFVVLVPRASIASWPVAVRPGGGATAAVIEGRGTVLPDLPAWSATTVSMDGSWLPDGLSVGDTPLSFRNRYRSGYRVIVGSNASVYVTGRLVDGNDEAIALEAGEIVDSFGEGTLFFTSRDGEMEILDVAPGEYRLYLYRYPDAQTLFAVPDGETGRFDLGDVVFLTEDE